MRKKEYTADKLIKMLGYVSEKMMNSRVKAGYNLDDDRRWQAYFFWYKTFIKYKYACKIDDDKYIACKIDDDKYIAVIYKAT